VAVLELKSRLRVGLARTPACLSRTSI